MKTFFKIILWTLVTCGVIVAVLREFVQVPDAAQRVNALPLSGPTFNGREANLTPLEQGTFGRATTLKRIYEIGNQRAVVFVIDPSRDQRVIHDPLFCLRGDGWDVLSDTVIDVPAGLGRRVALRRQEKNLEVVYWFSDTHSRHGSPVRRWYQSLLRRVTFGRSGPEPVLVLLQPMEGERVSWDDFFLGFPPLFDL